MKATLLAALSIGKLIKFSIRENSVFNFMFTENWFYRSTTYLIFKGMNIFFYWWDNMTFPFWKMVLVNAFVIWYSLNELINTSLYFFTRFLKTDLFWLLILGSLDMSWRSLSLLTILTSPEWLFMKELLYLFQQHLIELGSLRISSIFKWSATCL